MATVPTPYDATAAVKLTATAWYAGVRDPLTFLLDPPKCGVYQGTVGSVTTLANATLSGPLLFDTETNDTDNMHSTTTNTGRITFNTAGRYQIIMYVMITGATTFSAYSVNPRLNAGGSPSGGTSIRTFDLKTPGGAPSQATITFTRVFSVSDYIEIYVLQTSASSRTTDFAGQYCTGVQAQWISIT